MNSMLLIHALQEQRALEKSRRARRRVRRRRRTRIKNQIDQDQDKLIAELQEENEQLQLCLGALVQLLVDRNVLSKGDKIGLLDIITEDIDEED